jgi:hypothetical protein
MTDEIDINSKEYKEGFKQYKFVRDGIEMVIDKSCKKGICLHTTMYAILDSVDEEFEDNEVAELIEKLKGKIWKEK